MDTIVTILIIVAFYLVCFTIGWFLGMLIEKFSDYIYDNFPHNSMSSEYDIAIHEVGHMVAWMKYCPWWNNDYAYGKSMERINYLHINPEKKNGCFSLNKVNLVEKNIRNVRLYLGGLASMLLFHGRRPSILNIILYKHLYGCVADINSVRDMGYSYKEISRMLKDQIDDFTSFDRNYIHNVAKDIVDMLYVNDDDGNKFLGKTAIRELASIYRRGANDY